MDRYTDHFLDSCAIIGKILDFDVHHICADIYFKKQYNKHTSKRVEREIRGRLLGLRGELLSFFKWIKTKNFKGYATQTNVMRFLNKYRYHNRERNYRTLNRFFASNMEEIMSYLIDKKDTTITNLENCVIDSISKAENKLINLIYPSQPQIICHLTPQTYISHFSVEYTNVSRLINYEPDVLILLDSYYVKNIVIKKDIGFITTDYGDILSKSGNITSELPGIHVFDMRTVKMDET